ncbi:hypothetical protein OG301_39205 (plasmid) [Streptomyces platensis]|uniref:hypothetical protein n=1 Tax=Streptomyces platensis TaxID=58346 RepID=UPI002ED5A601|nr:hypothetical protein OG301_39205 [Streptomyces platensis]
MASATVPAAVPEPNEPTSTNPGNPSSGLFSSLLTPVDPVRPATFDIPAPTEAEGGTAASAAGASSASYHHTDEASSATGKSSGGAIEKRSVWRAWLLAGATRWAKGGGAENKRLDVAKTRAQRGAKEDRKVTVNRSEGLAGKTAPGAGGGGNSGGAKGNSGGGTKGPTKAPEKPVKNPPKEQPKGPRNSNGSAHQGPAGRSGGSGSSGGGGDGRGPAGGGSNSGTTPKNDKTDAGRDQKPKADLSKGKGKGSGTGGKGATGPAGSTGKPGTAGGSGSGSGKGSGPADTTGKNTKSPETKADPGKGNAKDKKQDSAKVDLSKGKAGKPGASGEGAAGKNSGPNSPTGKADKGKSKGGKSEQTPSETTKTSKKDGKPFTTRESRATGYRDGVRAAIYVAHARAYRDGVKDGWSDVAKAAKRQKAELDKAHEKRKKAREAARDKETDVNAASSADHHPAQPIEVVSIDAKNIMLGSGALRDSIGRGEVRNFVTFVARLEAKADVMQKVADATKGLKAEAEEQAKEVTDLLEEAKSPKVKAGEKLIAKLEKLADNAKVQAMKAEEVHKRALRAADACKALLSNVKTRYEPLFMAVVNSPEIKMPELNFFRDHGYEKAA